MKAKWTVIYGLPTQELDVFDPMGKAEFPYTQENFEADSASFLDGHGTPEFVRVKEDMLRLLSDLAGAINRFQIEVRLEWY